MKEGMMLAGQTPHVSELNQFSNEREEVVVANASCEEQNQNSRLF
jgi:hypothetical protein